MIKESEQLLWVAAVWIGLVLGASLLIRNRLGKIAFALLAIGIPFWEVPFGYIQLLKLCEDQAKLRVIEKIPAQDSVCLERFDQPIFEHLVRIGFSRVEVPSPTADVRTYLTKGQFKEKLSLTQDRKSESQYCLVTRVGGVEAWDISRLDNSIIESRLKKEVARESSFSWSGTWWQRQARPLLGRGGYCLPEEQKIFQALRHGSG